MGFRESRALIAKSLDIPDPNSPGFHVDTSGRLYLPFFTGWRLELGGDDPTANPFLWTNGSEDRVRFDPVTGQVYIASLGWGSTSQFVQDYWEGPVQPSGGGYVTPTVTQSDKATAAIPNGGAVISKAWPAPTTLGNTLIVVVGSDIGTFGGTATHSVPAGGYTLIGTETTNTGQRLSTFRKDNCAAGEAAPSCTVSPPAGRSGIANMVILEVPLEPTGSLDQSGSASTGSSGTPPKLNTPTSAVTTQTVEFWLGVIFTQSGGAVSAETNGFVSIQQQVASGGQALDVAGVTVITTGTAQMSATASAAGILGLTKIATFKAKSTAAFPAPGAGFGRAYWVDVGGVAHLFTKGSDNVGHDISVPTVAPNGLLADNVADASTGLAGATGRIPDAGHRHPFAQQIVSRYLKAKDASLDGGTVVVVGTLPDAMSTVSLADAATQGLYWDIPWTEWGVITGGNVTIAIKILWAPSALDAVGTHAVRWSVDAVTIDATQSPVQLLSRAGTVTAFTGSSPGAGHVQDGLYRDVNNSFTTVLTTVGMNADTVIRLNLRRLGADAADTYVGAARIVQVIMQATVTT